MPIRLLLILISQLTNPYSADYFTLLPFHRVRQGRRDASTTTSGSRLNSLTGLVIPQGFGFKKPSSGDGVEDHGRTPDDAREEKASQDPRTAVEEDGKVGALSSSTS